MAMYSIRECSRRLMAVTAQHEADGDRERLRSGLLEAVLPLIARPDLLQLGVKRQANHITNSKHLYYDGQMSVTLDEFPNGKLIPPHDHGIWEALSVYRGRIRHVVYERIDDQTVSGAAKLRIAEDRELEPGDFAIVSPPADIHSFTALSEGTYGITVVSGAYKRDRHYYQPESNTYVIRQGRNAR
jgi:predicted metal-dependent enzyme (double-stranded beta helix superfamily)